MAVDLDQMVETSITGTVTALGKPLGQARVFLESISGQGIRLKTYTDEDGAFVFNNLMSGTYRIRVRKLFHIPKKTVIDFQEGEKQTVDIDLLF